MKIHDHVSSHHSFLYLWVGGALLVLAGLAYSYIGSHPQGIIDGAHEGDVRTTIAQFGNQLNSVSLLAPSAAEDIARTYGPFVAPELLASWVANPESAPGRLTSSPWPDHIEVDSVTKNEEGSYDVAGRIILKTSTGDAGSVPVSLTVSDVNGSFLITQYEEMRPLDASSVTVAARLNETVSGLGVSLTPLQVEEDSRCSMDAMCIQQGSLRVSVMIESGMGTSTMPFTLASGEPVTTETASLWLVEAMPYPMASDPTEDEQYRFTFRIEQR